jgi:Mrp family chromosome partitioning ATPase
MGGGLLAAILLAILLERYRNIFHESSDVEYSFAEPILTKLNLSKSKITTRKEQKAWNELYTNLHFILPKKSQQTLLIASLNPEDRQTYVTANLANSIARLGQKVLVIDNHTTTPETYKDILTITGETSQQSCHSLMFSFPSLPNLSFFPLHKILDHEYYSINSLETHSLLESIAQGYNLIIYNSSNFLDLYDLSLLAERTDGIIFTIRLKHTPYSSMKTAIARIRKYNLKLLGFVVIS